MAISASNLLGIFVISIAQFFFHGCFGSNINLEPLLFPERFNLVIYENGKEKKSYELDSGNSSYKSLKEWYCRNLKGWRIDWKTYMPQTLWSSEKLKINIINQQNIVVVNYSDSAGRWKQVSKVIARKDLDFLLKVKK